MINDTMDVIIVNRCNQSDEFRTVLPAKLCAHVLVILMLAAAAVLVVGVGVGAAATTWYVDDGGGADFIKIQDAVDTASDGDAIVIGAGTYVENVDVYKRLTLIGEGTDVVTVTAALVGDHAFEVTADYVNISGFTMTGATDEGYAGIHLYNVNNCNIFDNNASGNSYNIQLWSSRNNNLTDNIASDSELYGIRLVGSSNNNLIGNIVSSNDWQGICLWDSNNNCLTGNIMSKNNYNFRVYGNSLSHFVHAIDTSNLVNGKPVYYWVGRQDEQVPDDAGFVGIVNSTNITVRDLTLKDNNVGVLFAYTNNSRIENVTTSGNYYYGIYLLYSSNNNLTGNNASDNYWYGICLRDSNNNNTLTGNTAPGNYYGIHLYSSSNNDLNGNNAASNCGHGIWLRSSSDNYITGNSASNNDAYGICLLDSSNNYITGNNASNNKNSIYLHSSSNNHITDNTASNNNYGFVLGYSSNNYIYHNNLLDNINESAHEYYCGTNKWNSSTETEGNYWSDYNGTDSDGDGIGDEPYPIPGGSNRDYYPLMQPWAGVTPQKGDLNGDNHITPTDAAIALKLAASGAHDDAADVSGDGCVTSLDALMILQAAAENMEL